MLKAIRDLITELTSDVPQRQFEANDERLAVAALLVHLISVDGVVKPAERTAIEQTLASQYGLSSEDTAQLIAQADRMDEEAVDLYGFTSVLKRALDEDGRRRVIEMMWEAVFADGAASEFEENTVWRVAELLGISSRDRITLRQRVAHGHVSDKPAKEAG